MWRNWRMPCFRTCSACRRVSSQLNGEPCDSSPMPARGGAGKKKGRGERRTEPERSLRGAACALRRGSGGGSRARRHTWRRRRVRPWLSTFRRQAPPPSRPAPRPARRAAPQPGGRGRGLRWQIPLSAPRGKATMGESGDLPAVCEGSCPVTFREHPPNAARGVGRRPFSCGRPAEMAAGKRPPRSRGRPSPRPGSARVGGGGWWSGLAGCSRWKGTPGWLKVPTGP